MTRAMEKSSSSSNLWWGEAPNRNQLPTYFLWLVGLVQYVKQQGRLVRRSLGLLDGFDCHLPGVVGAGNWV